MPIRAVDYYLFYCVEKNPTTCKLLFFSSRNDRDMRKNADSAQKCEKILLAFYVTTKPSKGNGLSVFARFCL